MRSTSSFETPAAARAGSTQQQQAGRGALADPARVDVAPGRLAGVYLMRALQRSIGNTAVQRALTGASSGQLMVQRLRLVRDPRKGAPGREWRKLRDDEEGNHFDTLQMQPHQIRSLLFDLLQDKNDVLFKAVLTEAPTNMLLEVARPRQAMPASTRDFAEVEKAVVEQLQDRGASPDQQFRLEDRVIFAQDGSQLHGVISKLGPESHEVRCTEEGPSKDKVFTVRPELIKPDTRVVGVAGVAYMGPVRPGDAKEVSHRGELEIEIVGGKQYVRLYLTVPAESAMASSTPATRKRQRQGVGVAKFKDVQQDPQTGKVVIATGDNGMLWVGGGRPLRALKWAEKYVTEHQVKAGKAKASLAEFETLKGQALLEAAKCQTEINRLQSKKRPTENDHKRRGRKEQEYDEHKRKAAEYEAKAEAARKDYDLHASIQNPLIRTYLFPYDKFKEITDRAILESQINLEKDGVKVNEDMTFNVDRHYEPNQYGFKGEDLKTLRENALPGSLITYALDPKALSSERSGEVRDARELRARLGIPQQDLKKRQWTEGGEFTDKAKFKGNADTLNQHYVTWQQSKQPEADRTVSPLMSGNIEIPYARRKQELDEFLVENAVADKDVDRFMLDVVGPWATQNAIAQMMADDYERMNRDVNIKATPYTNDFDKEIQQRAQKEAHQTDVGQKITEMIKAKATPAEIINFVIASFPELKVKFEEVCARTEKYQFYEHAQMVLGQYLALLAKDPTRQEDRVIPIDTVVKAIVFHDIEKENSKAQYTDYPAKKKKGKGQERHDKEGEHKLSTEMMQRYKRLWASGDAFKLATSLVDADPFGFYLRDMITANDAFMFIVRMARKHGTPDPKIKDFFYEYHQYYQADFSSYTSASSYRESVSGEQREGKETSLGQFLERAPEGGLKFNEASRGFEYSDVKRYKNRFGELERMFASTEAIVQKFYELATEEEQLERHKNKRRFANPVM